MGLMMKGQGWGPGPQQWIPSEAKATEVGETSGQSEEKEEERNSKDYFPKTDGRKGDSTQ